MSLPENLIKLINQRGHLRNLGLILPDKWPEVDKRFRKSSLKLSEFIHLELGRPIHKCECGNPTLFKDFVTGYKPFCSKKCSANSDRTQDRKRQNYMSKYGVEHQMQRMSIKRKVHATMTKRYGAPTTLQSECLKAKAFATSQKKYGADTFLISKRGYAENLLRQKSTQVTRENTMLERYGVRSPLQIPEIQAKQQKNAYVLDTIRLKGYKFRVRGREEDALKFLVNVKKLPVRCISVSADSGVPTIDYKYKGKDRKYYPDFLLTKGKRQILVEVKSEYTLGIGQPEVLARCRLKFRAAARQYEFWLFIYYKKTLVLVKNPGQYSTTKLVSLILARCQKANL